MSALLADEKMEWVQTMLGRLCGERGQSIEPAKTPDAMFELYSVPSFPDKKPEIVAGKEIGSNKQRVETQSVLLSKINPRINRAWVVGDFTRHEKIASTEWIVFPPSEEILPAFLCYFLQQNVVRDFLAHNASGVGGSLMRVKPSTLRDFPFAYPKPAEQRLVVAEIEKQFTRLDAGIAALRRVQANLRRYRATVLKAACEGRLVPSEADFARKHGTGFESGASLLQRILTERRQNWQGRGKYKEPAAPDTVKLASLPEGWTWTTVGNLVFLDLGFAFRSTEFAGSGIRLLRGENLEPGKFRWMDTRFWPISKLDEFKNLLISEGEIVLAMDRPLISSGLKIARARADDVPCLLVQRMARFRPVIGEMTPFLFNAMNTDSFIKHLVGGQQGTQLPHISGDGIQSFPIALPPFTEQMRIVAEVERRLSVVEELEMVVKTNLQRANCLRQSILRKAFTGDLTPRL
jgi:type I restriction enzyme S subunit